MSTILFENTTQPIMEKDQPGIPPGYDKNYPELDSGKMDTSSATDNNTSNNSTPNFNPTINSQTNNIQQNTILNGYNKLSENAKCEHLCLLNSRLKVYQRGADTFATACTFTEEINGPDCKRDPAWIANNNHYINFANQLKGIQGEIQLLGQCSIIGCKLHNLYTNFNTDTHISMINNPTVINNNNPRKRSSSVKNNGEITKKSNNDITTVNTSTTNNNDFVYPSRKHTARPTIITLNQNNENSINTTNQFDSLPRIPYNDEMPPVMIKITKDYRDILKLIDTRLGKSLKNKLAGEFIKVWPTTSDEHRILTDLLKNEKIASYIINPRNARPIKVVIKGLPTDNDKDEIKSELNQMGFICTNVSQLTQNFTKKPLPIFLCTMSNTDNIADLYKIDKFMYMHITVEKFRGKGGVSQCFNCNGFSHSSLNCLMPTRCLKCGLAHSTKECNISDQEERICINCKRPGHRANWKGCTMYPKTRAEIEEQQRRQHLKETRYSQIVSPGRSYANIANTQNIHPLTLSAPKPDQQRISTATNSQTSMSSPLTNHGEVKDLMSAFEDIKVILELIRELGKIFKGDLKNLLGQVKSATNPADKMYILLSNMNIFNNPINSTSNVNVGQHE